MAKTPDERPFYVYRENKGYFYGPGANPALVGRTVDWKVGQSQSVQNTDRLHKFIESSAAESSKGE